MTSIWYPLQACVKIKRCSPKSWGKWNQHHFRVGSMSLLNMALVCIRVRLGTSHLVFRLPPWVWIIPFDLSSAHCLVTMTSDLLMSNTAKSTIVPLYVQEKLTFAEYQPSSDSHMILIHKKHHVTLSRVDDVGNIMAHLRSRSLPIDFSPLSRKLIQRLPSSALEPACLNGRFFAFDVRFSSLASSDRVILQVFDVISLFTCRRLYLQYLQYKVV